MYPVYRMYCADVELTEINRTSEIKISSKGMIPITCVVNPDGSIQLYSLTEHLGYIENGELHKF